MSNDHSSSHEDGDTQDSEEYEGSEIELGSEELSEQVEELEFRLKELESRLKESKAQAVGGGWALGMAIAVVLSWSRNASILWCIFHGILSWLYVVYFAVTRH